MILYKVVQFKGLLYPCDKLISEKLWLAKLYGKFIKFFNKRNPLAIVTLEYCAENWREIHYDWLVKFPNVKKDAFHDVDVDYIDHQNTDII